METVRTYNNAPLVVVTDQGQIGVFANPIEDIWVFRDTNKDLVNSYRFGKCTTEDLFISDIGVSKSVVVKNCSKDTENRYDSWSDVPDNIKSSIRAIK